MTVTTAYFGFDGQLDYGKDKLDKFVPTVLVGLGGTGRDTLLRFRKNMFDEYPIWREGCLKYLVIDTDDQTDSISGGPPGVYDAVRIRRDQGEFVPTGIAPQEYREVLNNVKQRGDRRFKSWMHPDFEQLVPPRTLEIGSGTIRQAGRLAFFLRHQTIRDMLEKQIRSALDFAAQHPKTLFGRPGSLDDSRLEVVIVTSLAGGTGSGMFIDLAYLVRNILETNSDLKRITTHITLIAALPNVYCQLRPHLAARFRQNAYAALLEMEHYNTPRPLNPFGKSRNAQEDRTLDRPLFRVNWSDPVGEERDLTSRPWDTCYLIDDTHDYARTRNRTKDDVCQMVADYLFLDFGNNPFAIAKRSARSNHTQLTDRRLADQVRDGGEEAPPDAVLFENFYGCTYSSFGLAEIFFDRERLYRIAGYRFAQIIVDELWLQNRSTFPDAEYKKWAREDLGTGVVPAGEKDAYKFDFGSLVTLLLQVPGGNGLRKDLDREFDQIENEGASENSFGRIRAVVDGCENRLSPSSLSNPNSRRQQILTRCQELLGQAPDVGVLRNRLRTLLKERFTKLGINPVLQLTEEFRELMNKSAKTLRGEKERQLPALAKILARLKDAEMVPFLCKSTAVRVEFKEAVDGARKLAQQQLDSVAAEYGELLATELRNYVDSPSATVKPPYKTVVENFTEIQQFLQKLSQYLDKQFALHSQIQTDERKQSLLPVQTLEEYNDLIRMALLKHPKVNASAMAAPTYDKLKAEGEVLQRIPKRMSDGPPWSRTSIMDAWLEDYRNNPDILSAVAETLSRCCQDVLRESMPLDRFKGGNVVDLMIHEEPQRADRIQKFVDGSTVALPMANIDKDPSRFRPAWRNLLGLTPADPNEEKSQKNVVILEQQINGVNEMARGGVTPERQAVHESTSAFEARMVLVRELAGIPLHAYDRLGELAKDYFSDAVRQQRELSHLRWRDTFEELPDIERISSDEYAFVQQEVLTVLRGIMLQFIRHDQDGRFSVKITDERRAGELVYSLGSRITRVIKHASVRPTVVTFLRRQWLDWQSKVAARNNGLIYAIFYNAVQQTLGEFPRTVEYRGDYQRLPLQYCLEQLQEELGQQLCSTPEGKHYYEQLRRRNELDPDLEQWAARFAMICDGIRKRCLQKVNDNLPFYTLNWKEFRDLSVEDAAKECFLVPPAVPEVSSTQTGNDEPGTGATS